LLILTENPSAPTVHRATGLYHFAILVPSRVDLAQVLKNIGDTETPVQGFSDHLVSEAIYLADLDGNGIEVYRDRPRAEWYDSNGNLRMASDPLDLRGLLGELNGKEGSWAGLDPKTVLGHMHLQIADVRREEAFYRDVLGFDVMMNMGSASFVSAGGYHHHIGMNIWNSAGAPPPPPDAVGLRYFTVQLPSRDGLSKTIDRVRNAGVSVDETETGLLVRDPSHNGVVLTTQR
jgi:catechol 2,3-dioxygenase